MNLSFARLEEGYENALKDYYKKQVHKLAKIFLIGQAKINAYHAYMYMYMSLI